MDEVSSGTEPDLGTVVLGDEVDMALFEGEACMLAGV